jgi:hypothetical protein
MNGVTADMLGRGFGRTPGRRTLLAHSTGVNPSVETKEQSSPAQADPPPDLRQPIS